MGLISNIKGRFTSTPQVIVDPVSFFNKTVFTDTSRPANPLATISTDTGAKLPMTHVPRMQIFQMCDVIGDLKAVIDLFQREVFKNGWEAKPRFEYKCKNCGEEYDDKPIKFIDPLKDLESKPAEPKFKCERCEKEGEKWFRRPNPYEGEVVRNVMKNPVNANHQTLLSLAKEFERFLDIDDNAFCVALKHYNIVPLDRPDEYGAKFVVDEKTTEIAEFLNIHPVMVGFIADAEARIGYDDNSQKVFVCPRYDHRDKKLPDPVCPLCKTRALQAIVEVNSVYSMGVTNPKTVFYTMDELIWVAGKRYPNPLYGYSPILAIHRKAMALYYIDEYIMKYYDKERPARNLLVINSKNWSGVKTTWDKLRRGAERDPHMPRPLLVDNDKGGARNAAQLIDLIGSLKDLEVADMRMQLLQSIYTTYGVPPFVFGEVSKGGFGGANMQVISLNRTLKESQEFLEDNFFDQILRIMGVEDWRIHLKPAEEMDELRKAQLEGQHIANASKMHLDLGYDTSLDGHGKPKYSQAPNPMFLRNQIAMNGSAGSEKKGDAGKHKNPSPGTESATNFGGEPAKNNPSDVGGSGQGSPSSGASVDNR